MANLDIERFLKSSDFNDFRTFVFANHNGEKPDISDIIKMLCSTHGFTYESDENFLLEIRDYLRQKISSKVGHSNNTLNFAQLSEPERKQAELDRIGLLRAFDLSGNGYNLKINDVNSIYIDYKIIYDELLKCSPEKIAFIMKQINSSRQEFYKYHTKEAEKNPSSKDAELHKNLAEFYKDNDYQAAIPVLFQTTEKGNFITSNPIERNIPKEIHSDIKKLQFISNLLESIRMGLYAKGEVFDGSRLTDYQYGPQPNNVINLEDCKILKDLTKFDMSTTYENQSRLGIDDDSAQFYTETEKDPLARHSYKKDSKEISIELSSNNKFFDTTPTDIVFPLYIKYKEYDKSANTFTLSLYTFFDDDISHGTQLYRIDKVNPIFRGRPAPHKQLGGEILETYQHIHEYNLLNQVVNSDKKRGHFDVSQNLITMFEIDKDTLELIFDNKTKSPKPADFEKTENIVKRFYQGREYEN